ELKVYEEKILGAEDKIAVLEQSLYEALVRDLIDYIIPIQLNASLIAKLDCLQSFAKLAKDNHYVRPVLTNEYAIDIKEG
ncbi:UNVERIFIED_CONTAM: hypothetical protein IGO34_36025, partial [Salmonella enterica subsp. enterica serovar Weltevreden]